MPADADWQAARRDLAAIFTAAIAAVDPARLVGEFLVGPARPAWLGGAPAVAVVGAGKAAARMAAGVEATLGPTTLTGIAVVPPGDTTPLRAIRVVHGSHPLPDERSCAAAGEVAAFLAATPAETPLLWLISGGASSLLVEPRPPLTLADKLAVHDLLLRSGVAIDDVNAVRKHLSTVKGGGLLRAAAGHAMQTLLLSDVVGDDPAVIGSGPTVPDPTTYGDALAILARHGLTGRVPKSVIELLHRGARGEIDETVKPDDPLAAAAPAAVIGSNRVALRAAACAAKQLGYQPVVEEAPLVGDTTRAAQAWAERVRAQSGAASARWCLLAGGETTVMVRGRGRGGRNQEFALAAAGRLAGRPVAALSAGTDGIDGPTDAAGAFVDGRTCERARQAGLDPAGALAANDSHSFFAALGDLHRCGPTGTNVMDIKVALRVGSAP